MVLQHNDTLCQMLLCLVSFMLNFVFYSLAECHITECCYGLPGKPKCQWISTFLKLALITEGATEMAAICDAIEVDRAGSG